MKRWSTFVLLLGMFFPSAFAACPSFGNYGEMALGYNLNADPFYLGLGVTGDTTGASVQWYTYTYGQGLNDTIVYQGGGANTVSECLPATDVDGFTYYVCVIKTPACPLGVVSNPISVTIRTNCETFSGQTFTLSVNTSTITEGDKIVLTATYSDYGGQHYFVWTHNGTPIDSTATHQIWNDPDNFHESILTIPACELSDSGTYSVSVSDGTDGNGSPCSMTVSNPKNITINPKPECAEIVYRKWKDLLLVDNGNNQYASYQWYRDNVAISGATRQYLYTDGVILEQDGHKYYVIATTKDGTKVKSCEDRFEGFPKSVDGRQSSMRSAVLYSHLGTKVGEWTEQPASVSVAPGMYIWCLTDDEGFAWTQKVVY